MFETNVLGPRFMRRRAHANLIQGGRHRARGAFSTTFGLPFPRTGFFFWLFTFGAKTKRVRARMELIFFVQVQYAWHARQHPPLVARARVSSFRNATLHPPPHRTCHVLCFQTFNQKRSILTTPFFLFFFFPPPPRLKLSRSTSSCSFRLYDDVTVSRYLFTSCVWDVSLVHSRACQ